MDLIGRYMGLIIFAAIIAAGVLWYIIASIVKAVKNRNEEPF